MFLPERDDGLISESSAFGETISWRISGVRIRGISTRFRRLAPGCEARATCVGPSGDVHGFSRFRVDDTNGAPTRRSSCLATPG
jgi:hypothetical protein